MNGIVGVLLAAGIFVGGLSYVEDLDQERVEYYEMKNENLVDISTEGPTTVGEIEIPGVLKEKIGHSGDNEYYLSNNSNNEKDILGSVFMDFRNDFNFIEDEKNTILYGHNNKNGTIFGNLKNYLSKDFLKDNPYVYVTDQFGEKRTYAIFSVYESNGDDILYLQTDFKTELESGVHTYPEFVQLVKERSMYKTSYKVNEDTDMITLSTCNKQNNPDGRTVIHAVEVNEKVMDNDIVKSINKVITRDKKTYIPLTNESFDKAYSTSTGSGSTISEVIEKATIGTVKDIVNYVDNDLTTRFKDDAPMFCGTKACYDEHTPEEPKKPSFPNGGGGGGSDKPEPFKFKNPKTGL